MKKIIFILLIGFSGFAQKAVYNKTTKSGNFTEYETKKGELIKIGDTITIGYPFSGSYFTFITQGGAQTLPTLSNQKVVISNFKSIGKTKTGFKVYPIIKGYGWVPIYIDYESALETGEIKQ